MDPCDLFEKIQLETLLGDATRQDKEWALQHAGCCRVCRHAAEGDERLSAAFDIGREMLDEFSSRAGMIVEQAMAERRVFCGRVEGPFGPLFLARSRHGLCRVSFRRSEEEFMDELERHRLLPQYAPSKLSREATQLEKYFAGRCKEFRIPVDLRLVTPFQRSVLEAAAQVPFGELVSYSDIARQIGKPNARRAVGGALGKNPVAIVIPCHRVVAADGTLGGYTGGLDIKRVLMRIEGIVVPEATRQPRH